MVKREKIKDNVVLPEEDQPYKIPENWSWTKVGAVSKILRGVSYKKHQIELSKNDTNALVIRGGNIQNNQLVNQDDNVYIAHTHIRDEQRLLENDIVIVSSTGSKKVIGKAASVKNEFKGESFGAFITTIRPNNKVDSGYFELYYQSPLYRKIIASIASGSNINNIKKGQLETLPIPLPPFDEQRRIAKKVQGLLDKVDDARKLIEEAKESFELRRAALLDRAFRGELTKEWRSGYVMKDPDSNSSKEGLYKLPIGWTWTTIGKITTFVGSGSTPRGGSDVYKKNGVPFIRSQNVLRGKMDNSDIVYISEDIHKKMKRTQLNGNETLLNITGASIGRAAKLDNDLVPCNVNQHVCALNFDENINKWLPQYWLNSPFLQREINKIQVGVTRQALNFSQVKSLPMPLIPRLEQDEIIRVIQRLDLKEEKIYELGNQLSQLDTLKQSILLKAFKGDLGTNNNDENAVDPLKEIFN